MSKSDWRSRVAMLSRTGSRKIEEMLLLEYYGQSGSRRLELSFSCLPTIPEHSEGLS